MYKAEEVSTMKVVVLNFTLWNIFQITFTLGYMMVPVFAYFIRDYSKLQLLAAAPPLVFFIVC